MTLIGSLVIGLSVFAGTFVSGIFGMVGGQIVLATCLYYLPVSAGMTVFSALMFTSGAWRGLLWRQHINWQVTWPFLAGSIAAYVMMLFISFVPTKAIVYLGIGLTPIIMDMLPKKIAPDIERPYVPYFAGFLVMFLQIALGAGGNVLDAFFQASTLNRHITVATKAIMQLFSQAGRFFYFGWAALNEGQSIEWTWLAVYIVITFIGGSTSASVLNRMSDVNFRKWTRALIWGLSAIYVARGIWLLTTG